MVLLGVLACAGPQTGQPPPTSKLDKGKAQEEKVNPPDPPPLARPNRDQLLPLGLAVAGSPQLKSPAWVKRSLGRATGIGNPGTEGLPVALMQAGGDSLGGYAGAGIIMGYLLYLPVGATIGYFHGKAAAKTRAPCIEGLRLELQEMAPVAELERQLQDTLAKYLPTAPVSLAGESPIPTMDRQGIKSLLNVALERVEIKEAVPRGTFFVEVALTAQLRDRIRGKTPLFQTTLVYGNLQPLVPPQGTRVPASSPGRKLEAYCGQEGRRIFRAEVVKGLRFLVDRLALDLGLWGPGPPVNTEPKSKEKEKKERS